MAHGHVDIHVPRGYIVNLHPSLHRGLPPQEGQLRIRLSTQTYLCMLLLPLIHRLFHSSVTCALLALLHSVIASLHVAAVPSICPVRSGTTTRTTASPSLSPSLYVGWRAW
ncbi:hypothetical protein LY78DRAFT_499227 [Colletotrichum sublineola]|nr:hypothetical protein LY78DRAFT_499227 [Colletotrichum sublineola]